MGITSKEIISVVLTHWAQSSFRSETLRVCLSSLIETTKGVPAEIIVVDNGENLDDSLYLLNLAHSKQIEHYIRNARNMHFGYARNQAIQLSCGEFLVISDNDIKYEHGWAEACRSVLIENPDNKLISTPLRTDRMHRQPHYWKGEVSGAGKKWLLNLRAGSNSFMVRRTDFERIGWFRHHRIAGSHWNNSAQDNGFVVATLEKPLAEDIGFKQGYNHKQYASVEKVFTNGEKMGLNN